MAATDILLSLEITRSATLKVFANMQDDSVNLNMNLLHLAFECKFCISVVLKFCASNRELHLLISQIKTGIIPFLILLRAWVTTGTFVPDARVRAKAADGAGPVPHF